MSSSDMNPTDSSPNLASSSASQELPERSPPMSSSDMNTTHGFLQPTWVPLSPNFVIMESEGTKPNNTTGKSNFINTVTAIFKEKDIDVPISIFKVPNSLISSKPEAYVPQTVSLGPVYHSRRELQHMEMYKVMEAKRIHKGFESGFEFDKVTEFLEQLVGGPSIRASYCIYFDMEDDDLACVMAVDGLFLLDLLCRYGIDEGALANSSSLSHLVNSTGQRLAQEMIIQEAMMLENQIPISVMKVLLIIQCSETTTVRDLFPEILTGFCKFISPLTTLENYPWYKALKHAHLLDLLYHLVTLKLSPEWDFDEEADERRSIEKLSNKVRPKTLDSITPTFERITLCSSSCEDSVLLMEGKDAPLSLCMDSEEVVQNLLDVTQKFAPQEFLLPLRLLQSLCGKLPEFRSIISFATKKDVPAKKVSLFPTAAELHSVGVKFHAVDHITDISFDSKEACFNLPSIRPLNVNSEVVIRNLVAYEAMIKSEKEPPILNWYVELMNGLIKTDKDVEVLRDQEIFSKPENSVDEEQVTEGISSKLESLTDEQVAKIFSGMNKSVELKNIPKNLENAVSSVKRHYATRRSELESTFMVNCRPNVTKWCNFFLVLLALCLLGVQAVCSVYECPRFSFKTSNSSPVQQGLQLPSLRSHLI